MVKKLVCPDFFYQAIGKGDRNWTVNYAKREEEALELAKKNKIKPASMDQCKICVMPIDMQVTFCSPQGELFVAGRSGDGAVQDCINLSRFGYEYLDLITEWAPTLDTHLIYQISHPLFWINDKGEHPAKNITLITYDDVLNGKWKVNPEAAEVVTKGSLNWLQSYALHYTRELTADGKYPLQIWTYHAMLGSVGNALSPIIDEMTFFHGVARQTERSFQVKGNNPLTENYSVFSPEVLEDQNHRYIAEKNWKLIRKLLKNDILIIAGEAGDYCVAWSIDDLLTNILILNPELAKKVYILEDCISPVVIPGVYDGTDKMETAFKRFEKDGMHVVKSTDPIENWPDIEANGLKV